MNSEGRKILVGESRTPRQTLRPCIPLLFRRIGTVFLRSPVGSIQGNTAHGNSAPSDHARLLAKTFGHDKTALHTLEQQYFFVNACRESMKVAGIDDKDGMDPSHDCNLAAMHDSPSLGGLA